MFDAAHKKRRPHACLQGVDVASQDTRRDNARVVSNDGCPEHKNRRPTTPVSVGHAKSCGAIQLISHTVDEWDAYARGLQIYMCACRYVRRNAGGNAWDRWRQRVRCLYGGELDGMLDIFWALNLGSLGTTRALFCRGYGTSSVGCLPEKIISRKAARPQRGGYAQISGIYPPIFPQLLT
jgi:hypothetical protein